MNTSKKYEIEQFLDDITSLTNTVLHNRKEYEKIIVRGRVKDTSRYDTTGYITLTNDASNLCVTARWDNCADYDLPHTDSYIEFEGYVKLKPDTFSKVGLQVHLIGEPLKLYQPDYIEHAYTQIKDKKTRITLPAWLERHSISDLLIVGSDTGITDLQGQMDDCHNVRAKQINVGNAQKFCDELDAAVDPQTKAIIITRGGDDNTIQIFNKPELVNHLIDKGIPFYTAIGHNKPHLLIEKHCDQAFPTPSSMGSGLHAYLKQKRRLEYLQQTVNNQKSEIEDLHREAEGKQDDIEFLQSADDSYQHEIAAHNNTITEQKKLINLLSIILLCICALVVYLII